MLRVGLTGGLGSGKSTVAAVLASLGAVVVSADEIGRELMQPGHAVFEAIVRTFGEGVRSGTGELDRAALARMAFTEGRLDELNGLVHPAVIARQTEIAARVEAQAPEAVFVVESALLLETAHGGPGGWRSRFDRVVLVVAEEQLRIERFVARRLGAGAHAVAEIEAARADARRRMTEQWPVERALAQADFVVRNEGSTADLRAEIEALWPRLVAAGSRHAE